MARLRTSGRLSPCATQSLRKPAAPSARTRVRHSLSRSSEQRPERLSAHQRSSSSASLRCLGSKKGQARCERSITFPSLEGRGRGWVLLERLDAAEEASSWASSPFVSNPPLCPLPCREGRNWRANHL